MATKTKGHKLEARRGWTLLALCWVATFLAVWVLRQAFVPREELDCYARVTSLQKAVDRWNKAYPQKPMGEDIDEKSLVQEGLLKLKEYDREKHYHFVGETAHGPRVKCNKHQDQPLVLRLTGVTLLSVLAFLVVCGRKGYRLFD